MKSLVLLALAFITTSASAACFNFVNGNGPDRLGNVQLAAKASKICISNVNRMGGGSYTSIRLSDAQGDLAIAAAELTAQGRCAHLCQLYTLQSGNANGMNVNLSGINLTITAQEDHRLGILNGVVEIQAGRGLPQKYLIMK